MSTAEVLTQQLHLHHIDYKNGRVALTWSRVYLSCSFTTKQCEYKQINYIAGPL